LVGSSATNSSIRPQPHLLLLSDRLLPRLRGVAVSLGKVMAKKTLNAGDLEALGAARLAELLIEISEGNAAAKRRLRLELAAAESPTEVAKEVRKRLATMARSRTFVDWQNRKLLVGDLEAQRRAIVDRVAKRVPAMGWT
jgi:hypothetical protein